MKPKRNLEKALGLSNPKYFGRDFPAADPERVRHLAIRRLGSAEPERNIVMLKSKKKLLLIAAVVVLALSLTAFAADIVVTQWYGTSSSADTYTSLPAEETCVRDAGYAPVLLERFQNGYVFSGGSLVKNKLTGESGQPMETFKSFSFDYTRGENQVILTQERYETAMEPEGSAVAEINGVELYYFDCVNRSVAPDYQLTETDRALQTKGDIVFSFGISSDKDVHLQILTWQIGDMHFNLTQMDGPLSQAELIDMAAELIHT